MQNIIDTNNMLREALAMGRPADKVMDAWDFLQARSPMPCPCPADRVMDTWDFVRTCAAAVQLLLHSCRAP